MLSILQYIDIAEGERRVRHLKKDQKYERKKKKNDRGNAIPPSRYQQDV